MENLFILILVMAFCALAIVLALILRPRGGAAQERLLAITEGQARIERSLREELARNREETVQGVRRAAEVQSNQLASIREELQRFGQGNDARMEALRETVDRKLREMQADNTAKLE